MMVFGGSRFLLRQTDRFHSPLLVSSNSQLLCDAKLPVHETLYDDGSPKVRRTICISSSIKVKAGYDIAMA